MKLKRVKRFKELEIVSLIDVVFLLIIFGIVLSVLGGTGGEPDDDKVSVMKIRIEREPEPIDPEAPRRLQVRIINSAQDNTIFEEYFTPDEQFLALSPSDFERLPACTLIANRIRVFVDSLLTGDPNSFSDFIEVSVSDDTKLRIINFITKACTPYREYLSWVRLLAE